MAMYAPDPASQNIATIGGNIAENSEVCEVLNTAPLRSYFRPGSSFAFR